MEETPKRTVGWREWAGLPRLGVDSIKAKLDTGARTSALHAFDVEPLRVDDEDWVRFAVHPMQRSDAKETICQARILGRRWVTNPGGRRQRRIIIETTVRIGDEEWPIELGLTDRDEMGFRLLLGRSALSGRLIVDPAVSYRTGRRAKKKSRTRKWRKNAEPGTAHAGRANGD